jgi:hypothetical protein
MKVEADKVVVSFFELAEEDPRIRSCHLGLYTALLSECLRCGGANPFSFSRARIMKMAKINSRSTYSVAMGDLVSFGFIKYLPSKNSLTASQVFLRKLDS